jgi:hypothetical protein
MHNRSLTSGETEHRKLSQAELLAEAKVTEELSITPRRLTDTTVNCIEGPA